MLMLERVFHHASRFDLIHFRPKPGQYLAFLGRIAPEKRVDRAIAIAQQIGMDLKIDAKVDPTDREHFETVIAPLFREPLVEYVGEKGLRWLCGRTHFPVPIPLTQNLAARIALRFSSRTTGMTKISCSTSWSVARRSRRCRASRPSYEFSCTLSLVTC
jgi:glycosyltransferase involved in cell wall biosynthesis